MGLAENGYGSDVISFPCSRTQTMRHAHRVYTELNSAVQNSHNVTPFLLLHWPKNSQQALYYK